MQQKLLKWSPGIVFNSPVYADCNGAWKSPVFNSWNKCIVTQFGNCILSVERKRRKTRVEEELMLILDYV